MSLLAHCMEKTASQHRSLYCSADGNSMTWTLDEWFFLLVGTALVVAIGSLVWTVVNGIEMERAFDKQAEAQQKVFTAELDYQLFQQNPIRWYNEHYGPIPASTVTLTVVDANESNSSMHYSTLYTITNER